MRATRRTFVALGTAGAICLATGASHVVAGGLLDREAVRAQKPVRTHKGTSDEIEEAILAYLEKMPQGKLPDRILSRLFPAKDSSKGKATSRNSDTVHRKDKTDRSSAGLVGYRVRKGDSVRSIGRRTGVSARSLLKHNPKLKKRAPYIGEELLVVKVKRPPFNKVRYTWRMHTVRKGETISGLSRRYGVSAGYLKRSNRLRPVVVLKAGSKIRVGRGRVKSRRWHRHKVKRGETLFAIARRYGVSPYAIKRSNKLSRADSLQVGQTVRVRVKRHVGRYHQVKRGQNLHSIARRYKTSPKKLLRMNQLPRQVVIRVGQRLRVGRRAVAPRGYRIAKLFEMPVTGRLTSRFGRRRNPFTRRLGSYHSGIDLGARQGTQIRAAAAGVVVWAGRSGPFGLCVLLRHPNGYATLYAHAKEVSVRPGSAVKRAQVIGRVGRTGNSTGPHLHFEVRRNGRRLNPLAALKLRGLVPK